MKRPVRAAKEPGCALQLDAKMVRLELNDVDCSMAAENGVKIALSTDAHPKGEVDDIRRGVVQERRGGLSASNVANSRGWSKFLGLLARN